MRMIKIWCMAWTAFFFSAFALLLCYTLHFPFDSISVSVLIIIDLGKTTIGEVVRFCTLLNMALIWIFFFNRCLLEHSSADIRRTTMMRK